MNTFERLARLDAAIEKASEDAEYMSRHPGRIGHTHFQALVLLLAAEYRRDLYDRRMEEMYGEQ